ncbi:alpha/beta hydrolase [Kineococcus sp. SYSU DK005]|uniref:alpha/beta hydrolase n=1 Tax=Kineococcus sp. SYSU DK005 TaxID=3383126 RepID=UPI003D7DA516
MPTDPAPDPAPGPAAEGRTIVFVHGLWLSSASWAAWRTRFEAEGHTTLAPEWPGMDVPLRQLRERSRGPDRADDVGLTQIVDAYARTIAALAQQPILIGHSFGGLIVQLLLDRGLGSAGVAISPASIKGVNRLPLSTLRSAWAVLRSPANRHRTVALSRSQWHYAFANTLSRAESDELWEQHWAPTPGLPLWQAATAALNRRPANAVDLANRDRPPLLIHANGADHTVPASVSRAVYRAQKKTGAVTDIHEFPGRPHLSALVDGWQAVADDALQWALRFPGTAHGTSRTTNRTSNRTSNHVTSLPPAGASTGRRP